VYYELEGGEQLKGDFKRVKESKVDLRCGFAFLRKKSRLACKEKQI
jgi:hypothetical protein